MPLFGAKPEIAERASPEEQDAQLLALNERTIKLGLLFHRSIHRRTAPISWTSGTGCIRMEAHASSFRKEVTRNRLNRSKSPNGHMECALLLCMPVILVFDVCNVLRCNGERTEAFGH